jgi:phage repressor protein C with HTH and peptisase S24 domain
MAEGNDTDAGRGSRLQLLGSDDRSRWLSVLEHPEFCVLAPDDSMAPAIRQGARLTFDTRLTPAEGDYTLIVDGAGGAYVREYRSKASGGFRAVATGAGFRSTLHATRDRLAVLGVLTQHSISPRGAR